MLSWLLPVGGAVLVTAVLRDVFHTLFHPAGQGDISIRVFRGLWALTGRMGGAARALSGPLSMVAVTAIWIAMLVLGWALIQLPAFPEQFVFVSPLVPAREDDLGTAVYYSWVTLTTLGYGDIAADSTLLRILSALQATLGLGIFTLVVTWVLSVYPALQRQRSAAGLGQAIRRMHERASPSPGDQHLARQMERLSDALHAVRVDFLHYPSTFYFAAPARTLGLADVLPFLVALSEQEHDSPDTSSAAAELAASLELFAVSLAEEHLDMPDATTEQALRAFRDHYEC